MARLSLSRYPRNPILWMNLARLYTCLGLRPQAVRAATVAFALAPTNRFVLRSSSRLFLHQGSADRAHDIIADSPALTSDPWLLAAEIAVSHARGRTSRHVKRARRQLKESGLPPFQLSELASALGTLEALAGQHKRARRLIRASLTDPSENSVAQAAWLERNEIGMAVLAHGSTCSFEADAWAASRAAKWDVAIAQARNWQNDQPFSSRPAILGSYLAGAATADFEKAIEFARRGLVSNPDDFTLINNLAFSLAQSDEVSEAQALIRRVSPTSLSSVNAIVFTATSGLIAYRSGHPDEGRSLYLAAIEKAERSNDERAAVARIYLALEELRRGGADAEALKLQACRAGEQASEPATLALLSRLKDPGTP